MRYFFPLLPVAVLLLSACGSDEHEDIKQWMKQESAGMRGRVLPLPEIKPFPIISYGAEDLTDPFSSAKVIPEKRQGGGGVVPNFDRPKEPLESHALESLHLIGVVRKTGVMHALIQAADGTVHQVRAGQHMGQNFGMITAITDSEVRITELVQDPSGQSADWIERPATLQLQDSASGARK